MVDDAFFRKAETRLPGGEIVERDWQPSERYALYARGWRDGAGLKPMRKDHVGLGPYDRGYTDGAKARGEACNAEAKRLEHEPSILRVAEQNGSADR